MYNIQKKNYGYKLTFADFINEDEMAAWLEESKSILQTSNNSFGVFVDMRALKPLSPDSQEYMQEGQKLFKQKGMVRSVVIMANPIIKMQFTRIAKETGIYEWERYIDVESTPNWEKVAIDWIENGIDPDK